MKIIPGFLVIMVLFWLTGCINEGEDPSVSGNGERIAGYVGVNLLSNSTSSTKADYEDGTTAEENEVGMVRFYFFNSQDNGVVVDKTGGEKSFIDVIPASGGKDMDNIEKILETTLVIEVPKDIDWNNFSDRTDVPSSLIAIVNPPSELNSLGNTVNKDILIENASDYGSMVKSGNKNLFVMSNAVYSYNGQKMVDVSLSGKIKPDRASALQNPVEVHVERVLAKVRLAINLGESYKTDLDGVYKLPLTPDKDNSLEIGGGEKKEVYIKFLGWNVTARTNNSNLLKNIDPDWDSDLFGAEKPGWNNDLYHRSFWAINPEDVGYLYGDFNGTTRDDNTLVPDPNRAVLITDFEAGSGKNYVYVQENAAKDDSGDDNDTNTKIIIAAQLVEANGETPIEFAEYAYKYYTIDGLKGLFAKMSRLWKKKENSNDEFEEISVSDIIFKTASSLETEYDKNDPSKLTSGKRYYVYAVLTNGTYYQRNVDMDKPVSDRYSFTPTENGNEILKKLGPVKIWKSGYTYYFLNIEHLGSEGAKGRYGVVRNHIYDYKVTSVMGLGAPVFDPDEVIVPEDKQDDKTFVSVDLRITNWRLFRKQIEITW